MKQAKPEFTKSTLKWYMDKVTSITAKSAQTNMLERVLHSGKRAPLLTPGTMYTFLYDAKLKDTLPYWDKFPLILVIEPYNDGFLGLNLHYLAPEYRFKLLQQLIKFSSNTKYDNTTRLKLSWDLLKSSARSRLARKCVKRYLTDHRKSKMVKIPMKEWPMVVLLPTQRFVGATAKEVWLDTLKG